MAKIDTAAGIIGKERLAVGTQCGFSTSVLGNALSIADEARKLHVMVEAARAAFGET